MARVVQMTSAVLLVVFLLKMESVTVASAAEAWVDIYNQIQNESIYVECGAKGGMEDILTQTIVYQDYCGWGFEYSTEEKLKVESCFNF